MLYHPERGQLENFPGLEGWQLNHKTFSWRVYGKVRSSSILRVGCPYKNSIEKGVNPEPGGVSTEMVTPNSQSDAEGYMGL